MKLLRESILIRWILYWVILPLPLILLAEISEQYTYQTNAFAVSNLTEFLKMWLAIELLSLPLVMSGCFLSDSLIHLRQYSVTKRLLVIVISVALILGSVFWIALATVHL